MSQATETWVWYDAALPSNAYNGELHCAGSDGTTWVGFGAVRLGSVASSTYRAASVVTEEPAGEWDLQPLGLSDEALFVNEVAHADGVWVAVGGYSDEATLVLTADDPNGPWAEKELAGQRATGVVYGDGTWALITRNGEVFTASDPTGTWTSVEDFDSRANARIGFHDGTFVVAYPEQFSPYAIYVYSATDPSAAWTARGTIASTLGDGPAKVGYTEAEWFVRTRAGLRTKSALTDATWTLTTTMSDYLGGVPGGFEYGGGTFVEVASNAYGVKTASAIGGTYNSVDGEDTPTTGTNFRGPFFNGTDWVVLGSRSTNEPGVFSPAPGVGGSGWGVLL